MDNSKHSKSRRNKKQSQQSRNHYRHTSREHSHRLEEGSSSEYKGDRTRDDVGHRNKDRSDTNSKSDRLEHPRGGEEKSRRYESNRERVEDIRNSRSDHLEDDSVGSKQYKSNTERQNNDDYHHDLERSNRHCLPGSTFEPGDSCLSGSNQRLVINDTSENLKKCSEDLKDQPFDWSTWR